MKKTTIININKPTSKDVENYLNKWDSTENYVLQENALNRLFFELCASNDDISNVLIKCSALNDFYSTNIFSVFAVAKHIVELDIDERLKAGDLFLVNDISHVTINGRLKNFYSFASKYCSHHFPEKYAIYDSYVDKVLVYFNKVDEFSDFRREDLKDYEKFNKVLMDFRSFYGLDEYNLKDIDRYVWQLGKEYFPKKY